MEMTSRRLARSLKSASLESSDGHGFGPFGVDIQTLSPIAGKDYPQTWNEFLDWFPTEAACLS